MSQSSIDDPKGPVDMEGRWQLMVEKALAGRRLDDWVSTTAEGLRIEPLGRPASSRAVAGRGAKPWTRFQRIDQPDAFIANESALDALNAGATGLSIVCAGAPSARGFGVRPADLAAVLLDVEIDACSLRLETGADGLEVAVALSDIVRDRRIDPSLVDIAFGVDPIGAVAATGFGFSDWQTTRGRLVDLVSEHAGKNYPSPFLSADGRRAHEAGASAAMELAIVLATAVGYLRLLLDGGVAEETALRAVDTVIAADDDQFMTIAKFRAIRLLWTRVLALSSLPAVSLRVHGETSFRMLTKLDARSNLIRATIAAFAAGVGGADSISALPFTSALGLPAAEARRLALNTQSILIEEANLFRVADPGAGSGSIQQLTLDLAAAAWTIFQTIERDGGMPEVWATGALQSAIGETRRHRAEALASGQSSIIGTNLFIDPEPERIDIAAPYPAIPTPEKTEIEPLLPFRTSAALEEALP